MAEENQTPETEEKVENQEAEVKAEEAAQAENAEAEAAEAENAEAETAAEEPKEPTLEEKYAALEKENAELKDQLLRRAADFDNYRKRMIKEKAETAEYANSNLLADLLDSLDNFDRTVDAAATATDPKAIADGIKMINGSLVKMLEDKYGLTAYGKEGDEFNPDEHEAIGRMEEEGVEKETLKQIYLKGYKLKDRIIRNAKVMVSVPKV
ncbi:MAG: nucleotide exchange factor GrpE [Spirochaetia bacterium]|nr:nucleotide exchange factor GrpE [Spirochaetia bacterium]MDD7269150.1 nucleotide exchange factor GrpE [Treponema sp.]